MDDERKDLNYIYFGCYNDYIEKRLGFRYTRTDWEDNIPPFVCMTNCQLMHRSNFFGITRGDRCRCAPIRNKWIFKYFFERFKENNTECNINCFGNRGEKCGGNRTYSMYRIVEDTSSSVPTSSQTTAYAQGITSDNSNISSSIKDGRTTEHGIAISIIAGVSVGVALLLILLLLLVLALIRHRSKINVSRTLQSSHNTDESVRYDNVPQSIQGSYSPYATLTVQNDCPTYDDLIPKEDTYENTETVATSTERNSQK